MPLTTFVLCHQSTKDTLDRKCLYNHIDIACGMSKIKNMLSESSDFYPTYASWNSILFESSVILTISEHLESITYNNIAILHSDTTAKDIYLLEEIEKEVSRGCSVGITVPPNYNGNHHRIHDDPMMIHPFDSGVYVWDYIKKYDSKLHQWAIDNNPDMIWAHQFACQQSTLKALGAYLRKIASKLILADCGLWTPHMFERMIGVWLAMHTEVVLIPAFTHHGSSSVFGQGELNLYGVRPRRYYNVRSTLTAY